MSTILLHFSCFFNDFHVFLIFLTSKLVTYGLLYLKSLEVGKMRNFDEKFRKFRKSRKMQK